MNRPAIDDLLGGILSGWYESVADWAPPGQASAVTCTTCSTSLLRDTVDVSDWPHDLVHQLADSLESATLQIFDAIASQSYTYEQVRGYVTEWVRMQADDLVDVVHECVEGRLDDWIAREVERGFADAENLR